MSSSIDYVLEVLATSPEEMDRIAARLKQASSELVNWVAERFGLEPSEAAQSIETLLRFEPVDDRVGKARRFRNTFYKYTGIVKSHLYEISEEFPKAVFLLEFDLQASYWGRG